jgi:7tm Chemosensory receptor
MCSSYGSTFKINLQMQEIATKISKILSKNQSQMPEEAKELFESFYVQVCHQPVTFSACGFFTINMELLISVATGVLSYLVILVQFSST